MKVTFVINCKAYVKGDIDKEFCCELEIEVGVGLFSLLLTKFLVKGVSKLRRNGTDRATCMASSWMENCTNQN